MSCRQVSGGAGGDPGLRTKFDLFPRPASTSGGPGMKAGQCVYALGQVHPRPTRELAASDRRKE